MKTTTSFLIALGLASSTALAQVQTPSQPPSSSGTSGAQSDSRSPMQPQPGADTSGPQSPSPSGMPPQPTSGASGTQSGTTTYPGSGVTAPAGTSGPQSGPHAGMPEHPGTATPDRSGWGGNSGASGTSGTSGTSGASEPPSGMQPMPATGASGTQSGADDKSLILSRLQPKTENGVTYICGGVGKEEVSYMKREAKKHDLALTFADRAGEFMADVNVAIADSKGNTVLQTKCDGPMMLVDLPKGGTYKVVAEANGYKINKTVSVKHGKKREQVAALVLTWPTQVAHMEGPAETATGSSGTTGTGASSDGKGKSENQYGK